MAHQQTPTGTPAQAQYAAGYPQGASPADHQQYIQPPLKRPRLSPEAQSPAPGYSNGAYRSSQSAPVGSYGNPYAQPQSQQQYQPIYQPQHYQHPQNAFNTPDPYPGSRQAWPHQSQAQYPGQQRPQNAGSPSSSQMMPPPPKPVREEKEEKVGVDDINDALFSSGINLKDEENYMHNLYNNRHSANDSFASHQGTSFGSSTATQSGSFSLQAQGSFSTQPNVAGAGTIGAAVSEQDVEQELKHKRTAAARAKAEADQHQLINPFVLGNILRLKLEKISREQGVRIVTDGLYVRQAETRVAVSGSNGMVAVNGTNAVPKPPAQIDRSAPLVDVMSLISLATGERLRGLLDESHSLARARRYADYGRVPIDFQDIATAVGTRKSESVVPESITGTPWDQPEIATDKPQSTVAFQSAINVELRTIARREQTSEKARAAKREARRKAAEAAPTNGDEAAADAPDAANSPAPSASEAQPKITKKELARQQKEKASVTEAQAATTVNQTAAMMALGKKGSRYAWMTGGAASMPTNRYAKDKATPSALGSGTSTPKKGARTPLDKKDTNSQTASGMSWGQWTENSAGGRGIQSRDWLLVLERDGKQKMAWEKAVLHMDVPSKAEPSKA